MSSARPSLIFSVAVLPAITGSDSPSLRPVKGGVDEITNRLVAKLEAEYPKSVRFRFCQQVLKLSHASRGRVEVQAKDRHSGVSYELWDIQTGNLVGGYETEESALAVVRRSMTEHGRESVETLGLARESRGRTKTIAVGAALAERALAADSGQVSTTTPASRASVADPAPVPTA